MRFSKVLMLLFLLGGGGLLGGMIGQVGLGNVLTVLSAMGWWVIPFLCLELVATLFHTAGWAACFQGPQLPIAFWQLWLVRLAGAAINQITPTATVGGEVVRVLLLEKAISRAYAVAAVMIGKLTVTMGQMVYLFIGTLYLVHRLSLPQEVQYGVYLTILLISLGLLGFIGLQRYGVLSYLMQRWARLSRYPASLSTWTQRLHAIDTHLGTYYKQHPWRFVGSLGWHALGFAFVGIKTYILLYLLLGDNAPDLAQAFAIAVAVEALDQMFFFVPGRLGTLEGVRFTVLSALGIAQVYGLAFGLIGRLEQLVWSGLGLAAYGLCTHRPALLTPRSPSSLPSVR